MKPLLRITFVAILAFLFFDVPVLRAQAPCYVRLEDASGYEPTAMQLAELQQAAANLCTAFDSAGFEGQFKVYDFGFYLHHSATTGGYPEPFALKVAEVAGLSPYYLLFGKETDKSGVYKRFWVDLKIPDTGLLSCVNQEDKEALSYLISLQTTKSYRDYNNIYHVYDKAEIGGINRLEAFIKSTVDCCGEDDCLPCAQQDLIESKFLADSFTPIKIQNVRTKVGGIAIAPIKDYAKVLFSIDGHEVDIASDISSTVSGLQDSGFSVIVFITSDQHYCGPQLDSVKAEIDTGDYDLVIWHHIQITDTVKKEGILLTNTFFRGQSEQARSLVVCGPVCWLLKGLGEFAVSVVMQASATWLVEDDISFRDALGKVNYSEALVEGIIAILPIKESKIARAATVAFFAVYKKATAQDDYDYSELGSDYMKAFAAAAIEEYLFSYGSKYGKEKIIRGLLKKANFKYSWIKQHVPGFDLSYPKFCKKLGLGLKDKQVPLNCNVNGEYKSITSQRIMEGWNSKKIAIIGRSQYDRIEPYKKALKNKLGNNYDVVTIQDLPGWDPDHEDALEINRTWIRQLKENGYTFYDLGYDPKYEILQFSSYYDMEIFEILVLFINVCWSNMLKVRLYFDD